MTADSRLTWAAVVVLAAAATLEAGQVPFSAEQVISDSVLLPSSVHAADLDGDGDSEVLATSIIADSVCWWDNTGDDPSAWPMSCLDTALEGATAVVAADLDGDDDVDVLAAAPEASAGHVVWWENSGDAAAWTRHEVSSDLSGAWWLQVGDVDDDDDLDIAAVSHCPMSGDAGNEVVWFENTLGDGSAWTKHLLTDNFLCAVEVDLGDIDGDDDLDIIASALDAGLLWWEQVSPGSWTPHDVDLSSDIEACRVVDLDGDDDLDIAGAIFIDGILWWENVNGDGSQWTAHSLSSGMQEYLEVVPGDIDEDGDQDILGPMGPQWSLGWLDNLAGDASVWDEVLIDEGGVQSAIDVHLADLDGDHDLDALAADLFSSSISLWENRSRLFSDGFESGDTGAWSETGR